MPEAGLEPARVHHSADFESAASAIPPRQLIFTEHLVWFDQLKVDSMYKIAVCALYGTGNRGRTCTG